MKFEPHGYQAAAIEKILRQKRAGLFLDMGLGKTVISLTAAQELIYDRFDVRKVLVIAPKLVAKTTWPAEVRKWDHLKDLRVSVVLGNAGQREKALEEDADIYVVSRDFVVWLVNRYHGGWPFDMVIIDELSSFKNPQAKRFRALRKVIGQSERVIGLTGTPAPNSYMDLWSEIFLLDLGERLGKSVTAYRAAYFYPAAHNGPVVYKWELRTGADEYIRHRLDGLCMSMKAEDYLDLPERIDIETEIELDEDEKAAYDRMEDEQFLFLEQNEITAFSAAAVQNKLLQIANGRVYDESGQAHLIHEKKLDMLEEIVGTVQEPVLVFYNFHHDRDAIRERLPCTGELKTDEDFRRWNAGEMPVLLAHPASIGRGLNLQDGGHIIIWYGLTWNLEDYLQANRRLHRQGQTKPVIVHHLIAKGTIDERVMKALKRKDLSQATLLEALKERRKE